MWKNILILIAIVGGGAVIGGLGSQFAVKRVVVRDDAPIGCAPNSLWCSVTDEKNSTTLFRDRIEVKSTFGDGTIYLKDVEKLSHKGLTVRVFSKDGSNLELRFALLLDAQRFEELVEERLGN